MKLCCAICNRRDGPRSIVRDLTEDARVQDYPKAGLWFLLKKGKPLCLTHPRLDARFKPTEAMTPSNPRWEEFYKRLEGPEGCNFRRDDPEDAKTTHWDCAGGNDHTLTRKIMAAIGFSPELIEASCRYFASHGGFCDCAVLFNVNPVRPARSRKNSQRKT